MSNPQELRRHLHRRALDDATTMVGSLGADELAGPSGCAGWSVRDLVEHMVGQNYGFAVAIATGDAPRSAYAPRDVAEWRESAVALVDAVAAPAAQIRLVEVPRADPFDLGTVLAMHTLDLAVHVWDAVGDARRPSDETVLLVLAQAERIAARSGASGGAFAPPLAAPEDDLWHRALSLLGRAPDVVA